MTGSLPAKEHSLARSRIAPHGQQLTKRLGRGTAKIAARIVRAAFPNWAITRAGLKRRENAKCGWLAQQSAIVEQPQSMATVKTSGEFDGGDAPHWSKFKRISRRDFKRLSATKPLKQGKVAPWPKTTLPLVVLAERHHCVYGGPWILGRYAFEHLLNLGLLPSHKVLDVGCGVGRFGIHMVRFLDTGNYCGIDSHRESLRVFSEYELVLHGLSDKAPQFLWDKDFSVSWFGVEFDWIIDFATTLHVPDDERPSVFAKLAKSLAPCGKLLCANVPKIDLDAYGLKFQGETMQECPLLRGHEEGFKTKIHWREFRRA
jgi:SAM-dependent methyltransferase